MNGQGATFARGIESIGSLLNIVYILEILLITYKAVNGLVPKYLSELLMH